MNETLILNLLTMFGKITQSVHLTVNDRVYNVTMDGLLDEIVLCSSQVNDIYTIIESILENTAVVPDENIVKFLKNYMTVAVLNIVNEINDCIADGNLDFLDVALITKTVISNVITLYKESVDNKILISGFVLCLVFSILLILRTTGFIQEDEITDILTDIYNGLFVVKELKTKCLTCF